MDLNGLVSVIIPAYNIASYIERCVQSILNQTYKNLEILIVDDGSTDQTPEICDRLAGDDQRVRVFHKKNGGVSSARNLALKYITGDYVSIIDGDDWVEPSLYEDAIYTMQKYEADVFMFEYSVDTDEESIEHKVNHPVYGCITAEAALTHSITPHNRFAWSKVFASSLITDANTGQRLYFDESVILGEDTLFIMHVLKRAKRVYYSEQNFYHYVQRNGSATKLDFNPKMLSGLEAYFQVGCMLKDNGFSNVCIYADEALFELGISLMSRVVQNNDLTEKYIDKIKKYIEPIRIKLLLSRNVAMKTKVKVLMSIFSLKITGKILGNR